MILTDKIQAYVQELPATLQAEVLDFVEYLRAKARRTAPESVEDDWNGLSLALAMRGMEQEDTPYALADIKVSFE